MPELPDQLNERAAALHQLAGEVERLYDGPRATLHRLLADRAFAGALADRTEADLETARRRLAGLAEDLRHEAEELARQAARAEDTDSVLSDARDLVTLRDFTPWS